MKRLVPLLAALLLLLTACGASTAAEYMAPVDAYCRALQDNDFSQLQQAMPAAVLNSEGLNAGELDELRTVFFPDVGEQYTLSARALSMEEFSPEECRELEAVLLREYACHMTVTEARQLSLKIHISGKLEGDMQMNSVVYTDGTQWYVDFSNAAVSIRSSGS